MAYQKAAAPAGTKITIHNGQIQCPDNPVIASSRGDGTGTDVWAASVRVFDAAVEKAYKGSRKISWFEYLPARRQRIYFDDWFPEETVTAFRDYLVGIKGPLTTPVGGGIRSLERDAAPTSGFVRLSASSSVF